MTRTTGLSSGLPPVFTNQQARDAGILRLRRSRRGLDQISHGLWRWEDPSPIEERHPLHRLISTANAVGLCLPGAVLTHESAALIYGFPMPRGFSAETIHLARSPQAPHSRRQHVKVWRTEVLPEEQASHPALSIPLTTMRKTLLMLARTWTLTDLVCAVDWMVREPRAAFERRDAPFDDLPSLRGWAQELTGLKGVRKLREAAACAQVGSDSPQETRLRLALEQAGLPEPLCNPLLQSGRGGFLPPPDLAYPWWKVAVEYQGGSHFQGTRSRLDIEKRHRFESEGWAFIEVHSGMSAHRWQSAVSRVGEALLARGWHR